MTPTLHSLRVDAVVDAAFSPYLVDLGRIEGMLCALADIAGPGQSGYDPSTAMLDGPQSGITATCLFPGGTLTLHTYEGSSDAPGRYVLDVTASDPIDTSAVLLAVERLLGVPTDYQASTRTRGWVS